MMNFDTKFTFGLYKGLTLQEVYQGTLNPDRELITKYINKILNNRHESIPLHHSFEFIDKFDVSINTIRIIPTMEVWNEGTDNDDAQAFHLCEVELGNIQHEIKQFIDYHFSDNWLGILENIRKFNTIQELNKPLGGDPQYLAWCIRTIDGFKIDEETLTALQELTVSKFVGIEVIYKKRNQYEYSPIVRAESFKFSEEVIKLNSNKHKVNIPVIERTPPWEDPNNGDRYSGQYVICDEAKGYVADAWGQTLNYYPGDDNCSARYSDNPRLKINITKLTKYLSKKGIKFIQREEPSWNDNGERNGISICIDIPSKYLEIKNK